MVFLLMSNKSLGTTCIAISSCSSCLAAYGILIWQILGSFFFWIYTKSYLFAVCALIKVLFCVTHCHQAAVRAHVDSEQIWNQEKSLSEEITDTVRNDAVPLHFTESQTSGPASSVGRLSGYGHHRPSGSGVHLIVDQMSQSLIVNRTDEDQIL